MAPARGATRSTRPEKGSDAHLEQHGVRVSSRKLLLSSQICKKKIRNEKSAFQKRKRLCGRELY